jgi:enoyl-CoA hydratase
MTGPATLRTETDGGVRSIILARPAEYNTITPQLRDELAAAIDEADCNHSVKVILLRAEGKAFCAGFGLDWSTLEQSRAERSGGRRWDSVRDLRVIGAYADAFSKLHSCSKPTIAAVQGWCIAGGTDLAFNCDLIICADNASFGYPPARIWGVPEQPWLWVARMGLFTGDEFTGAEALTMGLVQECVPEAELLDTATALARRMALLPLNQLQMMKLVLNDTAHRMFDPPTSRMLGCLFDGVARNTQEGVDFVDRAMEIGWRASVSERDGPFGDYAERKDKTK